jgi:hypothetical protein
MDKSSTGYPHFLYKKPLTPQRFPCTCVLGTNHWAEEPVEEEK